MSVEAICQTAKQFWNTYLILKDNEQHIRDEINKINPFSISPVIYERMAAGELKNTGIPLVVNVAFASELYLKALYLQSTGQEADYDHDHYNIFMQLPMNVQERLIEVMKTMLTEGTTDEFIHECIEMNSGAFNTWRYLHQFKEADHMTNFAAITVQALQQVLPKV